MRLVSLGIKRCALLCEGIFYLEVSSQEPYRIYRALVYVRLIPPGIGRCFYLSENFFKISADRFPRL